jgi:hypothetical protein
MSYLDRYAVTTAQPGAYAAWVAEQRAGVAT